MPILEKKSGLKFNKDFFAGYSPERINPGDKEHRLPTIRKVTSGSTPETADYVDSLYGSIITAGTHKASSIKVAEAAKVIENTQRDINIALINELALIFNRLGIDTEEVLKAAGTKWNFLNFRPGLVGGHCIGVDPYYLTYKARGDRLSPGDDPRGPPAQRQHGRIRRERMIKLMIGRNIQPSRARACSCSASLSRRTVPTCAIPRWPTSCGAARDSAAKWTSTIPGSIRTEAQHEYGIAMVAKPEAGQLRRDRRGRRAQGVLALGLERDSQALRQARTRDLRHQACVPKNESDGRL